MQSSGAKGAPAPSSGGAPPPPAGGAPPPPPPPGPPPPPDTSSNKGDDDSGAGRAALFAEINKGGDVTKGIHISLSVTPSSVSSLFWVYLVLMM